MVQLLLNIPAFVLATSLLAIVPGQGMAMVLRQSFIGGARTALLSVLGNSTGLVTWGALSALGLSAIFASNPMAYAVLKWCGVAFLVFLAIQTAFQMRKESGKFDFTGDLQSNRTPGGLAAYRVGLFTNLTNVKAAVFAVAFLPVYVPSDFSLGWGIFILGVVWAAVSTFWYGLLISGVKRASALLARPKVRRMLTGASAVGLLVLAAGLAFS
jgi:threonine/homoserine/homoserine lactone efflux protein